MKNKLSPILSILALLCLLQAAPLFAHEEHCHVKKDGKMVDMTEIKSKKACDAKKGVWRHHHFHCHEKGTSKDIDAKDEKSCTDQNGEWTDHGHESKND